MLRRKQDGRYVDIKFEAQLHPDSYREYVVLCLKRLVDPMSLCGKKTAENL